MQSVGALQALPPPRNPCTMDSSSIGAWRRLRHDATNTTQQGCDSAHDDAVTSLAATAPTVDIHRNVHYAQI